MSSGSRPADQGRVPVEQERNAARSGAGTPRDSQLLEEILARTQHLTGSDEPLTVEELRGLRTVAEMHRGQPLNAEIAGQLVETLLAPRWTDLLQSPKDLTKMARQIADSLLEHPVSGQRLTAFWDKLGEATS